MQVMILAAGRSTRLGALGAARPKPLVPICGYPAITFSLTQCAAAGLHRVVINLHHHGEQIRQELGDGSRFGVSIAYSDEPELLGTGGGLAKARSLFTTGPLLVINGKVVSNLPLAAVVAAHKGAPKSTQATLVVRANPDPAKFAPISVDENGRIVGMRGRRGDVTAFGKVTDQMFVGVHILNPSLLDRLTPVESDVIDQAYLPALADGARLQSFALSGYFEEHSTPLRYLAGNLALLRQPGLVPHPPGPLTGIATGAKIHATAILRPPLRIAEGAVIEAGAVVGPDVVVSGGGTVAAGAKLSRVVVWPGAVASGRIEDAVVTSDGVVTE